MNEPLTPSLSAVLSGSGPLYLQVKRELMRQIEARRWGPGQVLPSEGELAQHLQVSIGTLRRAVDELVHEHVLVRHQGKGTFVLLHSRDRFLFQFFHVEPRDEWPHPSLRRDHEYPLVRCLGFERQRADETSAAALRLREGEPVFVIHNLLHQSGRPVVLDRIVISCALFKGLTEKRFLERESTVYNLYQTDYGITVLHAQERARATLATREAVRHLGVASGSPLLEVHRLALSFGERPVEYRVSTINTRAHDYVVDMARPE